MRRKQRIPESEKLKKITELNCLSKLPVGKPQNFPRVQFIREVFVSNVV